MVEKQAPTPEQIAQIPRELPIPTQMGPSPFVSKPPEGKQMPLDKSSMDLSQASADLQRQADAISGAMMTDRAMTRDAARQQLQQAIEDEDDRREMREAIEDVEEEAAHAEAEREEGDDDELSEAAEDVRTGIADLGEVAAVAVALRMAGADPSVVLAVQQAGRDMRAGETDEERTAFRERGQLIVDIGRFVAEHLPTLIREGMRPVFEELGQALTALSNSAREGTTPETARETTREIRGIFERVRTAVTGFERREQEAAASRLQGFSDGCLQFRSVVTDDQLRREIDRLRQDLDQVRQRVERGERVSDEEMRSLGERARLMEGARDNILRGREETVAGRLQSFVGRALAALRGGNREQASLQEFMASQYAGGDQEYRQQLERHSEDLSSGRQSVPQVVQSISSRFVSQLSQLTGTGGVRDAGTRGVLQGLISRLSGASPSLGDLREAAGGLASGRERRTEERGRMQAASLRQMGQLRQQLQFLRTRELSEEQRTSVQAQLEQLDALERLLSSPETAGQVTEQDIVSSVRGIRALQEQILPSLLREAGAPPEVVQAVERASALTAEGQHRRAAQIVEIATIFLQNRDILAGENAAEMRSAIISALQTLASPEQEYTGEIRTEAARFISTIRERLGAVSEAVQQGLNERTVRMADAVTQLESLIESGAFDNEALLTSLTSLRQAAFDLQTRLETDPASVTAEEYRAVNSVFQFALSFFERLSGMPEETEEQRTIRGSSATLVAFAIDSYREGGESEQTRAFQLVAEEHMQSGDAGYRDMLFGLGERLHEEPDSLSGALQSLGRHLRESAGALLPRISDAAVRERLESLLSPSEGPASAESVFAIIQVLTIIEAVAGHIEGRGEPETRSAAMRFVNRAIDALARGHVSVAASQLLLAREYMETPAEREAMPALSERLNDSMLVELVQRLVTPQGEEEPLSVHDAAARVLGEGAGEEDIARLASLHRRTGEAVLADIRADARSGFFAESSVPADAQEALAGQLDDIHRRVAEFGLTHPLTPQSVVAIIREVAGAEASSEQLSLLAGLYQQEFDLFATGLSMSGSRGVSDTALYFNLGRAIPALDSLERADHILVSSIIAPARRVFEEARARLAVGEFLSESDQRRLAVIQRAVLGSESEGIPGIVSRLRQVPRGPRREESADAFALAVESLSDRQIPLDAALYNLDLADAVSRSGDAIDRGAMIGLMQERGEGGLSESDFQERADILIARTESLAELDRLTGLSRTQRIRYRANLGSYFDLALAAHRDGRPVESRTVLRLAALYADSLAVQALGGDTASAEGNIAYVEGQLGDASSHPDLAQGRRRYTDIGRATPRAPGRPGREAWSPQASELPGEYARAVLGPAESAEETTSHAMRIRAEIIERGSALRSAGLSRRFDRILEEPESAYTRERTLLDRQVAIEEAAAAREERLAGRSSGAAAERHMASAEEHRRNVERLRAQAALVDRGWVASSVEQSREPSLGALARVTELEQAALEAEQSGDLARARALYRESRAVLAEAEAPLRALEQFNNSVTELNSAWTFRTRGRGELHRSIDIFSALGTGHDFDLETGEVRAGAPSIQRAEVLRRAAFRHASLGSQLVAQVEAAEERRDVEVRRLSRRIRFAEAITAPPGEGATPAELNAQVQRSEADAQAHPSAPIEEHLPPGANIRVRVRRGETPIFDPETVPLLRRARSAAYRLDFRASSRLSRRAETFLAAGRSNLQVLALGAGLDQQRAGLGAPGPDGNIPPFTEYRDSQGRYHRYRTRRLDGEGFAEYDPNASIFDSQGILETNFAVVDRVRSGELSDAEAATELRTTEEAYWGRYDRESMYLSEGLEHLAAVESRGRADSMILTPQLLGHPDLRLNPPGTIPSAELLQRMFPQMERGAVLRLRGRLEQRARQSGIRAVQADLRRVAAQHEDAARAFQDARAGYRSHREFLEARARAVSGIFEGNFLGCDPVRRHLSEALITEAREGRTDAEAVEYLIEQHPEAFREALDRAGVGDWRPIPTQDSAALYELRARISSRAASVRQERNDPVWTAVQYTSDFGEEILARLDDGLHRLGVLRRGGSSVDIDWIGTSALRSWALSNALARFIDDPEGYAAAMEGRQPVSLDGMYVGYGPEGSETRARSFDETGRVPVILQSILRDRFTHETTLLGGSTGILDFLADEGVASRDVLFTTRDWQGDARPMDTWSAEERAAYQMWQATIEEASFVLGIQLFSEEDEPSDVLQHAIYQPPDAQRLALARHVASEGRAQRDFHYEQMLDVSSFRYSLMGRVGAGAWVGVLDFFTRDYDTGVLGFRPGFVTAYDLIPAFRRWRTAGGARQYAEREARDYYSTSEVDSEMMFGDIQRQAGTYLALVHGLSSASSLSGEDVAAATSGLARLREEITGRPPGVTTGSEGVLARYARYAAVQRSGIGVIETGASIGIGIVLAPLSPLLAGGYFFANWASGAVERTSRAGGYEHIGTSYQETAFWRQNFGMSHEMAGSWIRGVFLAEGALNLAGAVVTPGVITGRMGNAIFGVSQIGSGTAFGALQMASMVDWDRMAREDARHSAWHAMMSGGVRLNAGVSGMDIFSAGVGTFAPLAQMGLQHVGAAAFGHHFNTARIDISNPASIRAALRPGIFRTLGAAALGVYSADAPMMAEASRAEAFRALSDSEQTAWAHYESTPEGMALGVEESAGILASHAEARGRLESSLAPSHGRDGARDLISAYRPDNPADPIVVLAAEAREMRAQGRTLSPDQQAALAFTESPIAIQMANDAEASRLLGQHSLAPDARQASDLPAIELLESEARRAAASAGRREPRPADYREAASHVARVNLAASEMQGTLPRNPGLRAQVEETAHSYSISPEAALFLLARERAARSSVEATFGDMAASDISRAVIDETARRVPPPSASRTAQLSEAALALRTYLSGEAEAPAALRQLVVHTLERAMHGADMRSVITEGAETMLELRAQASARRAMRARQQRSELARDLLSFVREDAETGEYSVMQMGAEEAGGVEIRYSRAAMHGAPDLRAEMLSTADLILAAERIAREGVSPSRIFPDDADMQRAADSLAAQFIAHPERFRTHPADPASAPDRRAQLAAALDAVAEMGEARAQVRRAEVLAGRTRFTEAALDGRIMPTAEGNEELRIVRGTEVLVYDEVWAAEAASVIYHAEQLMAPLVSAAERAQRLQELPPAMRGPVERLIADERFQAATVVSERGERIDAQLPLALEACGAPARTESIGQHIEALRTGASMLTAAGNREQAARVEAQYVALERAPRPPAHEARPPPSPAPLREEHAELGLRQAGEFIEHEDLPGLRLSRAQADRASRIWMIADVLSRGDAIPRGVDAVELALAAGLRGRLRPGDDRANMALAMESVFAEPATRTPEDFAALSDVLLSLARECRTEGRLRQAEDFEALARRLVPTPEAPLPEGMRPAGPALPRPGEEAPAIEAPVPQAAPRPDASSLDFHPANPIISDVLAQPDIASHRWAVVPPEQLPQWREQVWQAYESVYREIGLIYPTPEALFGKPRTILVSLDGEGRVAAFAFLKETPQGIQYTLVGRVPGSREGTAAIRSMLQHFSESEGCFIAASEGVAQLAVRGGSPVVPFDEGPVSVRSVLGEGTRGDRPGGMEAIRAMPGFAESHLVENATTPLRMTTRGEVLRGRAESTPVGTPSVPVIEMLRLARPELDERYFNQWDLVRQAISPEGVRPGARPEELMWADLVDQAVRNGDIQGDDRSRSSAGIIFGARPGARPEELTWADLVEQAVRDGEVPRQPETRDECYVIPMRINGEDQIIFKNVYGRPHAPEEPHPTPPSPRGPRREEAEPRGPEVEPLGPPLEAPPPAEVPVEAPPPPHLELVTPAPEEQALRSRADEREAGLTSRESLVRFALDLFREGDNPDGDAHQLLRRMSPTAQEEISGLVESEAFVRFAPTIPEGESAERISRRLRMNRPVTEGLDGVLEELSSAHGIPQAEEARAAVGYEGPAPDVRGGLIEGGLPRPETFMGMAGGGFSTVRIGQLRDAVARPPSADSPVHLVREAGIANQYIRAGYPPDQSLLAALEYTSRQLAHNLGELSAEWCSGEQPRRDSVISRLYNEYGNSPETRRMIIDTLTYLDAIGAGGMEAGLLEPVLLVAARSIVESWGGRPEPISRQALESLAEVAHDAVFGDGRITPPRDPAQARALGRLIGRMRHDAERMRAGGGTAYGVEHYLGNLHEYFPEFGMEASRPAATAQAEAPPLADAQRTARIIGNFEHNLATGAHGRRILDPETEILSLLVGDPASLPAAGSPERAARLSELAAQAISDAEAAARLADDYREFRRALSVPGAMLELDPTARALFSRLIDMFVDRGVDHRHVDDYILEYFCRRLAAEQRMAGEPLAAPLHGAERMGALYSAHSAGREPIAPDDIQAMRFIDSRTPRGTEPSREVLEQAAMLHDLAAGSTPVQCDISVVPQQHRSGIRDYEQRIRNLIWEFPDSFIPTQTIEAGETRIQVGSPMRLGGSMDGSPQDTAIPLFITGRDGQTRLVMAYQSESQACWRRFVGLLSSGYHKGGPGYEIGERRALVRRQIPEGQYRGQHFQDFDWRIQRALDESLSSHPPADITRDGATRVPLTEFGLSPGGNMAEAHLLTEGEAGIQEQMNRGALHLDLSEPGSRPARIVDYWWRGSDDGVYGRHPVILLESEDGRFQYAVAVTEDGMFVEFAQPADTGGLTSVGSPMRGAVPHDVGYYLPIIEYSDEIPGGVRREATMIGVRGGRARVLDRHASAESPLFELNNGLAALYPLLRLHDAAAVEERLGAMMLPDSHEDHIPLTSDQPPEAVPMQTIQGRVNERLEQLRRAYIEYTSERISPDTPEGQSMMRDLGIGRDDLSLFERYRNAGEEQRETRLAREALRFAQAEYLAGRSPQPEAPAVQETPLPDEVRPAAPPVPEAPAHSQRAQDLVALISGTLEREPTSAERIIADYLGRTPEFLEARARGDAGGMASIAEHFARYVESADRVVLRQDQVDAAYEGLNGRYSEPGPFRNYVDSVAAREGRSAGDILDRMAMAQARCDSLRATEMNGQFNSVVSHRQSVRFVDGERVREESYAYGGDRRGVPERILTREQYETAVSLIREAELSLINGTDPAALSPGARALLDDPEFVEQTRQIISAIADGRPVDRFRQMGIALVIPGELASHSALRQVLINSDPASEQYRAAIQGFSSLPEEEQARFAFGLLDRIERHDSSLGSDLSRAQGIVSELFSSSNIPRRVIRDRLLASTFAEAPTMLADHLGLTDAMARYSIVQRLITSGGLLNELCRLHPDMDSLEVESLRGAVGAYEFSVVDEMGVTRREYVKPVDMAPDGHGSDNYRASGIPAPRTVTAREDGRPLTFRGSDDQPLRYGISQDIADFEGPIRIAGHDIHVRTQCATNLRGLLRSEDLMEILMTNPQVFWEALGYLIAAEYALGSMDGHAGNTFAMLLEITNPADVQSLRDEHAAALREGREPGFTLLPGPGGTSRVFRFGRIDTDDGNGIYQASGERGNFDLTGHNNRMGGQHFLLRVFEHLTRQINTRMSQDHPDSPADHFISAMTLMREAFGAAGTGPIYHGVERWWREVGSTPEYQAAIRDGFVPREGQSSGISWSEVGVSPEHLQALADNGITYFPDMPMNGEAIMPIFSADGRTRLMGDYEIAEHIDAWPGAADVMGVFRDRATLVIVGLSGGEDSRLPSGIPVCEGASGMRFALFPDSESVPQELRSRQILVTRHGTTIRASPPADPSAAGFGQLIGRETRRVGALNVFDFIMGQGENGLIEGVQAVQEQLRRTERERLSVLRAGPIIPTGATPTERQRAIDEYEALRRTYFRERYPQGYDENQVLPLPQGALPGGRYDGLLDPGRPRVIEAPIELRVVRRAQGEEPRVAEPVHAGRITERARPEEPPLRTPEVIHEELDGIRESLSQLVRDGQQRDPRYRELLASAEDREVFLEAARARSDTDYMDGLRADTNLQGRIDRTAARLTELTGPDVFRTEGHEFHEYNLDVVGERVRLRAQLLAMREVLMEQTRAGEAAVQERPAAAPEIAEVSEPTPPSPLRRARDESVTAREGGRAPAQGQIRAGTPADVGVSSPRDRPALPPQAAPVESQPRAASERTSAEPIELLSQRTRALIDQIAFPPYRQSAIDAVMQVGVARIESLLANISTISDETERNASYANLSELLMRIGDDARGPESSRMAESFVATATDRELMLLIMDRRIDPGNLPRTVYELLNRTIPIDNAADFSGYLDAISRIDVPNHRNLVTGIAALRTFARLREILGPVHGDAGTLVNDRTGYPPELRPAMDFIRRFGLDPRIHDSFRLNSRDLMSRSGLYQRIIRTEAEFTSQLRQAFPGREALITDMMGRISEAITVQDVSDTNLPYTPHGWAHSLEVVEIGRNLFNSSARLRESLIQQFGSRERALAALDFANLLHDIGYGELPPGARKTAHPQIGADLFEDRYAQDVARLFGIDVRGRSGAEIIAEEPLVGDIYRAILLHGADRPGSAEYTPASDTHNPLLFITRLADNLDVSVGRMRAIQTDPDMLEALREMYEASPRIRRENPRREGESGDEYEARLRPLFEPIRQRYRVTPDMETMLRAGSERPSDAPLPRFARGRTFEDALLLSQLLDSLNDLTWPHFIGCERVTGFTIREVPSPDGRVRLDVQIEMMRAPATGEVGPGVNGSHYQVWRTHTARRSLFYDRDIPPDHSNNQVNLDERYETGIDINIVTRTEREGSRGEAPMRQRFTLMFRSP